jgi:hypothetical protein
VAGGNGYGDGINQLSGPAGLYVDDDETVYVADKSNHRIVEWKCGVTSGRVVVVAGGNGANQLNCPYDVIVDKERDSLIICDNGNRRVVRWPRLNGTSGETIISNIVCCGLTIDENGSLYVVDYERHEVRRYRMDGVMAIGHDTSFSLLCTFLSIHIPLTYLFPSLTFVLPPLTFLVVCL